MPFYPSLGTNASGGGTGETDWGEVGGTLADQVDLKSALDLKAAISSLGTAAAKNVGTAAGNVIMLEAITAKLPAVDGSQLTNLPSGPPSSGSDWGDITGTLSDQLDLQAALDLKADEGALGTAAALDSGTSDGDVVVVQAGGKLPALDGSDVTGIAAELPQWIEVNTTTYAASAGDRILLAGTGSTVTFPSSPAFGDTIEALAYIGGGDGGIFGDLTLLAGERILAVFDSGWRYSSRKLVAGTDYLAPSSATISAAEAAESITPIADNTYSIPGTLSNGSFTTVKGLITAYTPPSFL